VRTATGARRPPRVPEWLAEVARPGGGPVPWAQMGHAVLAIAVPVAVGLAAGHLVAGVVAGLGELIATMADRAGPYLVRVRRVAVAAIFGGAAGLLIGTAVNGRGWVTVPVMIVVAGVSALLSSVGTVWSAASLFLLAYAALGLGPIGALRPWWLTLLWFLAGVGWWLMLLVPGWLAFPRAAEQRRVAAVYRALAANLRAMGTEGIGAARRGAVAALNLAYEELLAQRAAASGRDRELALLMSLFREARLAAEAAAALDPAGERPPPQAAAQADAIARALLAGAPVPAIGPPRGAGPALLALYRALNRAADDVSGRTAPVPGVIGGADWPREPARPLLVLAGQVRRGYVGMFAIRLMLCIGVAMVLSQVLPLQRSYWVPLTVAVVLRPDLGSVFARALQSGAGTVIGASAGALILASRPPDPLLVIWMGCSRWGCPTVRAATTACSQSSSLRWSCCSSTCSATSAGSWPRPGSSTRCSVAASPCSSATRRGRRAGTAAGALTSPTRWTRSPATWTRRSARAPGARHRTYARAGSSPPCRPSSSGPRPNRGGFASAPWPGSRPWPRWSGCSRPSPPPR